MKEKMKEVNKTRRKEETGLKIKFNKIKRTQNEEREKCRKKIKSRRRKESGRK